LFIENGLQLSKGVLSFIVPKPLINNENYEILRELLLKNGLSQIVLGSSIFENAGVESCIFTVQTGYKDEIEILECKDDTFLKTNKVSAEFCLELPFRMINTEISPHEKNLFKNLSIGKTPLQHLVKITRGIEGGKSDVSITQEQTKFRLLQGSDQQKYAIDYKSLYVNYDSHNLSKFKDLDVYMQDKILIRRVSNV
jgi:hypothetical protein